MQAIVTADISIYMPQASFLTELWVFKLIGPSNSPQKSEKPSSQPKEKNKTKKQGRKSSLNNNNSLYNMIDNEMHKGDKIKYVIIVYICTYTHYINNNNI